VYAQLLNEATPTPPLGAPDRCPPALDAILAKAIATRRADRFPDVRRFLAALYEAGC
jgi:hypothetical protein